MDSHSQKVIAVSLKKYIEFNLYFKSRGDGIIIGEINTQYINPEGVK